MQCRFTGYGEGKVNLSDCLIHRTADMTGKGCMVIVRLSDLKGGALLATLDEQDPRWFA
jgi:hypothetical protein